MSAVPNDIGVPRLAAALNQGAIDAREAAAVRLLVEHGRWLGNRQFRSCIRLERTEVGVEYAVVSWPMVAACLRDNVDDDRLYGFTGTPSEIAVLGVATSIAVGHIAEAATSCDDRNWALIVEAVTDARGAR